MNETFSSPVEQSSSRPVNWPRVLRFLGLVFGLTWLLDLGIYLQGGLRHPAIGLFLQFQMLLPAFSAMLPAAFFYPDSPIYTRTNRGASRWFVYYFLLLTGLYLAAVIASFVQPGLGASLSGILLIPNFLGLILLLVLRWRGGKDTFVSAGMAGGRARTWFGFGLGLVIFFAVQAWLNYFFKLGTLVDLKASIPQFAASGQPLIVLQLSMALNAVIIGPFLGLIITFGEEYGWRGFLQSELVHLGRVRGVLLLGIIWGAWHWPVIWMGYNYPGQPLLGSLLMVCYCIILAFFLAYAVFKSKGVWTAAYLHALNNQALSFIIMAVIAPASVLYSFGIGLYGILLGAAVVLFLLRDPVWRERD